MRLSGSETILAVDDDPIMLELVAEVLKPLGYKVLLANSGEQALEIAASRQDKIDLLMTDVMLPGIKGQELAKQMITTSPEVNVLFMSGYLCPSMAYNDKEKGFEAFLQKPFTPSAMLRKIRKLLD
jgi:two-component system cell cycle sensor histidine kinase/response regulator CckA